jgi:hypothetical protein
MELIKIVLQLIVAIGIYNVWLVRFGKSTKWRGGSATDMKSEFEAYGMPQWFMMVIGFTKVTLATLLIAGIWFPFLVGPAALGLTSLMLGAIGMHIKVKDPLLKSLPAFTVFSLSLILALIGLGIVNL